MEGSIGNETEEPTGCDGYHHPPDIGRGGDVAGVGDFVGVLVHSDKSFVDGAKLTVESAGLRHNLVKNVQEWAELSFMRCKKVAISGEIVTFESDPDATRTHDRLLRRQMLYPAELPDRCMCVGEAQERVLSLFGCKDSEFN